MHAAFTAIAANPTAISIFTYLRHNMRGIVSEAFCTLLEGYKPNVPPFPAARQPNLVSVSCRYTIGKQQRVALLAPCLFDTMLASPATIRAE